jgi:hypothetical protein
MKKMNRAKSHSNMATGKFVGNNQVFGIRKNIYDHKRREIIVRNI